MENIQEPHILRSNASTWNLMPTASDPKQMLLGTDDYFFLFDVLYYWGLLKVDAWHRKRQLPWKLYLKSGNEGPPSSRHVRT